MAFNYSPKIVKDGLVFYLDAANKKSYAGTGTSWNDLSGNNNTGTLTNGPTFNASNGGSIVLDGTNDYININDATILEPSTNITIEAAFRMSSKSLYNTIVVKPVNGPPWSSPYASYMLRVQTAELQIGMALDNVWQFANHTFNYATNTFYHVAYTYNISGNKAFYLNGSSVTLSNDTIGSATSITYGTPPLLIGAGYGSSPVGEFFSGNIYFVKIYNTFLTSSQVLQNYNAIKSRFNLP